MDIGLPFFKFKRKKIFMYPEKQIEKSIDVKIRKKFMYQLNKTKRIVRYEIGTIKKIRQSDYDSLKKESYISDITQEDIVEHEEKVNKNYEDKSMKNQANKRGRR